VINTLARAGVKKLRIIDFDLVSVSSLNRHAFTFRDDVGGSKVGCTKRYLEKIYPDIECEVVEEFLNKENCERLLSEGPDFVADCIDDLDTKTDLLIYCVKNNIPVISSGGAGMKIDPSQIQVRDISDCTYDKLTKRLRDNVKKHIKGLGDDFSPEHCFQLTQIDGRLKLKIPMVISAEKVQKKLMPLLDHQEEDPDNFRAIPGLRLRTVPVVGTQPALFGIRIASYILNKLANTSVEQFSEQEDVTHANYVKLEDKISSVVRKHKLEHLADYNITDIYYAAREMWKFRCVKTGKFKPR
jgi:tRNA A37 threonylcarbamoyladenosine dehydratase